MTTRQSPIRTPFYGWLIVAAWDWAFNIGVYGGEEVAHYKPEQPIAFNHTLHAGKLAINCQYCHSSAEKSNVRQGARGFAGGT